MSSTDCACMLCCTQALAGAPQLLTMKVEAVQARHDLLRALVELQASWQQQLEGAGSELRAVWLCSRCAFGYASGGATGA